MLPQHEEAVIIVITIIYQGRNVVTEETNNNSNSNETELSFPRSEATYRFYEYVKQDICWHCQFFHSLTLIRPNLIFTHQFLYMNISLSACEKENLLLLNSRSCLLGREKLGDRKMTEARKGWICICSCLITERCVASARRRVTALQVTGLFLYHLLFIQGHGAPLPHPHAPGFFT